MYWVYFLSCFNATILIKVKVIKLFLHHSENKTILFAFKVRAKVSSTDKQNKMRGLINSINSIAKLLFVLRYCLISLVLDFLRVYRVCFITIRNYKFKVKLIITLIFFTSFFVVNILYNMVAKTINFIF